MVSFGDDHGMDSMRERIAAIKKKKKKVAEEATKKATTDDEGRKLTKYLD